MDESDTNLGSPDCVGALDVVIACDSYNAGQRAVRLLDNLACRAADGLSFAQRVWPFEMLAKTIWRTVAAHEAVEAAILIVAADSARPLSPSMRHWAEDVIQRKRGTSGAVIALLGPEDAPGPDATGRVETLRSLAQQAGLDFFAPAPHQRTGLAAESHPMELEEIRLPFAGPACGRRSECRESRSVRPRLAMYEPSQSHDSSER